MAPSRVDPSHGQADSHVLTFDDYVAPLFTPQIVRDRAVMLEHIGHDTQHGPADNHVRLIFPRGESTMEGKLTLRKAMTFSSALFNHNLAEPPFLLTLFTSEEYEEIKHRMQTPTRKNAGEGLKKLIDSLVLQRSRLDETLERIKETIAPDKVRTRVSKERIISQAVENAAAKIKASNLSQEKLRAFAELFLGDSQLDFTYDELPLAIARAQIGE